MKRGPKPTYDREQVRRLHQEGKTGREIAAAVGCHQDHVSYILLALGLRRKGAVRVQKPVDVDLVASLSAEGKSQRHIARACGCHPEKVRSILRGLAVKTTTIEDLEAADERPCGEQIGEWPEGLHFTDAKVPARIIARHPHSPQTESYCGNSFSMIEAA